MWMADYTFKHIDKIRVGDEVIGWARREKAAKRYGKEKNAGRGIFACDTLTKATVLGIRRLTRPIVEVTFASGRKLKCAREHTWLNYHGVKENNPKYIPAEVGKTLVHVMSPIEEREESAGYMHGYIHGLVDGDGGMSHGAVVQRTTSLSVLKRLHSYLGTLGYRFTTTEWDYAAKKPKRRRFTEKGRKLTTTRLKVGKDFFKWMPSNVEEKRGWLAGIYDADGYGNSFGQCPHTHPDVYAAIMRELEFFSFSTKKQKHQIYLKGGRRELVRFWNLCRPVLNYKLDDAVLAGRFKTPDKVLSISEAGESVVYCLKTTTGNYVIQGYASKNCDYTIRARLAGGIRLDKHDMNCLDISHTLLKHQEVPTSVLGTERALADEEARQIMQRVSAEYGFRHYRRPFRLAYPRMAGGYYGSGIPTRQLEPLGYKLVTDLV